MRGTLAICAAAMALAGCADMPGTAKIPDSPLAHWPAGERAADRADDRLERREVLALTVLFGVTGAATLTSDLPGAPAIAATSSTQAVAAIPAMPVASSVAVPFAAMTAGAAAGTDAVNLAPHPSPPAPRP